MNNHDKEVVEGFGDEWTRYDQSKLEASELNSLFDEYFSVFPWEKITKDSIGFDLGCGSGRWARIVAPRVKALYCIEPSDAIKVAQKNLSNQLNCKFLKEYVEDFSIQDNSMDFGYSLGVLHHIPDTQLGLNKCVEKLKPGAPFLVYLYYKFDNRPWWYKFIWSTTEVLRFTISRMPKFLRYIFSLIIACVIYYPLAKIAKVLERFNFNVDRIPLSSYRKLSFYTMKTDSLDRFGTKLERRFTKIEIHELMVKAGLKNIQFSDKKPFWCAVGYKGD